MTVLLYYCDVRCISIPERCNASCSSLTLVVRFIGLLPVAFPLAVGVLPPERVFVFLRKVTLTVIQTVSCSTVDTLGEEGEEEEEEEERIKRRKEYGRRGDGKYENGMRMV